METLKVLIADDEPDILEVMTRAIKGHGYDVASADNGQEAWEKIKKDNPDIILLDLIMPDMHGLTILKKLKENPLPDKWQPVVIVSALGELEDVKKGFSFEAEHYITKPCTIETILKTVDMMASQIQQRRQKEKEGAS